MVPDYSTALQVAKDHGLTCVTPDLQIVYAGAFITRVGQGGPSYSESQSRLGLYHQISQVQ